MKNTVLTILSLCLFAFVGFGQDEEASTGSLISDIMSVAPVTKELDETTMEADAEYEAELEEQKTKVEELLAKNGDKFKSDVGEVIEKFNKVLAKGIEQDVRSEKKKVGTAVHSLSMGLLQSKKKVLMEFNTNMTQSIRKLPRVLVVEKEDALKEIIKDYTAKFEEELAANKEVIKVFKETEHLLDQPEGEKTETEDQ